jgi:hypothetical protein
MIYYLRSGERWEEPEQVKLHAYRLTPGINRAETDQQGLIIVE